jgi:FecR protein
MQHPRIMKIVAENEAKRQFGAGAAGLRLAVLCLFSMAMGTGRAPAQDAAANVARVSFVQGSVQLLAGQGSDFQQAVMNMPVLDGSRLQTGEEGQAEVEFGDGSVARLTPNSALQFVHLGQDQVQLQQLGGLTYYEFNVGDGHPPFTVQFANVNVQPTANSILRVGMDAGWEAAVISGSVHVQGDGIPGVDVAENQSVRSGPDNNGAPYTVAQGISGDSWDNWNQDRDQAIAQEASQQTPVRDESENPQSENWNDLDADGNWYPVEGAGNVWVPAGVGAGWDPYGAGYWAYYPTFGYTWVSSYPWGWLPYHCGNWSYYSFGWGWAPGGCGRAWSPVIVVRSHPPGWVMPLRPTLPVLHPGGGIHPPPGQRLVVVDRGAVAKGPWAFHGTVPRADHQQAVNLNGREVAPVDRVDFRSQSFAAAKGTAPGTRAVLGGVPAGGGQQRTNPSSTYMGGANPPRVVQTPNPRSNLAYPPNTVQGSGARPNVGYPPAQSYNQRSTYVAQPTPTTHYSAPPPPHYSAPPPSHMSSPSPHH